MSTVTTVATVTTGAAAAVRAAAEQGVDPNSVTPGLLGFLATFALVLASIVLFVNMSRRLRRMRYREERDAERRDAEERDAERRDVGDGDGEGGEPRGT